MTELPSTEEAPLHRELEMLRRAVRLFWMLFAGGGLFLVSAVIPALVRAAPRFGGFGLGLAPTAVPRSREAVVRSIGPTR